MGLSLVILFGLLCASQSNAVPTAVDGVTLPCSYWDSINITDGQWHDNGSITFENTEFRREHHAEFNFIMEENEKVQVDRHNRGCICKIKTCIQICKPELHDKTKEDSATRKLIQRKINENGQYALHYIFDPTFKNGCSDAYKDALNSYQLNEEGNFKSSDETYSRQGYCLLQNDEDELEIRICMTESEAEAGAQAAAEVAAKVETDKPRNIAIPSLNLLTVFFIIATILVYLCIPQLMNLMGKLVVFYLTSLVCYFIPLSYIKLYFVANDDQIPRIPCIALGYLIYFSSRLSFAWSNVISFDLYSSFRTSLRVKRMAKWKRLSFYTLYAFGVASLLTALLAIIDSIDGISVELKPDIGTDTCYVKREKYVTLLYHGLSAFIMFTVNIYFFVSSAMAIHKVQKGLEEHIPKEEKLQRQTSLINRKDRLLLLLRLLVVMGIFFIFESFSTNSGTNFDIFIDVCSGLQGILIFILFILKPSVLTLMKQRWRGLRQISNASASAETTNISIHKNNTMKLNQLR